MQKGCVNSKVFCTVDLTILQQAGAGNTTLIKPILSANLPGRQISKIISQTNDQMIANIDASYKQSQQAADHINNQFSDYMRGVDRYSDGDTQIQLPSGYENAWVNDKGEYLLSNTQSYDPNIELNGNWKSLQKK